MMDNNLWNDNYKDARNLFRKYSIMDYQKNFSQKKYEEIIIDKNEDITVDYLFLYNTKNKNQKLNIIISGTHGVEGYAGSAIQCKTLDNIVKQKLSYDKDNVSYLFIHALNPYGYLHNRRCTKNNIDLNRNYLDSFPKTNYPTKIFELITTYLYSFKFIFLVFSILFQYGYTKSREYIVKGQYNHNRSLFYGGNKREHNIDVLENILDNVDLSLFDNINIFDVHTGLGKYGNLSIMIPDHTYQKLSTFVHCNNTTKLVNVSISDMYKDSKGSIAEGIEEYFKKNSFVGSINPIILEYGTYSNIKIFVGLLLENYDYINNNNQWYKSKNKLRELFFINKTDWKKMVLTNYEDIISQFI